MSKQQNRYNENNFAIANATNTTAIGMARNHNANAKPQKNKAITVNTGSNHLSILSSSQVKETTLHISPDASFHTAPRLHCKRHCGLMTGPDTHPTPPAVESSSQSPSGEARLRPDSRVRRDHCIYATLAALCILLPNALRCGMLRVLLA